MKKSYKSMGDCRSRGAWRWEIVVTVTGTAAGVMAIVFGTRLLKDQKRTLTF